MGRILFILSLLAVAGDGRVLNSAKHAEKNVAGEDGSVTEEQLKKVEKVDVDSESVGKMSEIDGVGSQFQEDLLDRESQVDGIARRVEKEDRAGNRRKRQAWTPPNYLSKLWLGGVDYSFSPSSSDQVKRIFRKAAKLWEQDTCIDFRENDTAKDRIYVQGEGTICISNIGKAGGQQFLTLGQGCKDLGTVAYEIGHALGFIHTMARHDRDEYVTINFRNIKPNSQFDKYPPEENNNYGLPYDYGSIMHYGEKSFAKKNYPTMVPRDVNYRATMGSPFISFIDLSMMNELYKCKEKCKKEPSVTCERGGFPHPRDCKKCVCPGGYGGTRCTERPEGCGETLQASSEWQKL